MPEERKTVTFGLPKNEYELWLTLQKRIQPQKSMSLIIREAMMEKAQRILKVLDETNLTSL